MAKPVSFASAAAVAFIAAVAVIGIVVGTRRTVADGRVFEADLAKANPGFSRVACDRAIPIDPAGARFRCTFTGATGRVEVEYTMDRDGKTTDRQIRKSPIP